MRSGIIAAGLSAWVAAGAWGQCEPEIVLTIPGAAYRTVVDGSFAYVAGDDEGLRILDISDPLAPVEVGGVGTPYESRRVAVSDGIAYIASEHWDPHLVSIIDVSDPTDPRQIGELVAPRSLSVSDVDVRESTLYIAVSEPGGVMLYDVGDPAHPAYLSSVGGLGKVTSVMVTGSRMHMTTAAGGGVQIVDVRSPRAPDILARWTMPTGVWSAAVRGSILYLPSGQHPSPRFLEILDVSDAASRIRKGIVLFCPPEVLGYGDQISVTGGLAVIAGGPLGDVRFVDVGVFPPRAVGSMSTPGRCAGVAITGSVAYIADERGGLHVVDISSCLPCFADCDRSGTLGLADLVCFGNLFLSGDHRADCDESGSLDFFDFLCFQDGFAAGCD